MALAREKCAVLPRSRLRCDCGEKCLNIIDQWRCESLAGRVAHYSEQPFAGARIVEPLERRSQSVFRDADTDLLRRDLLDRVRFVENNEVIGEKKPVLALLLRLR